jgi:hypothetical protein
MTICIGASRTIRAGSVGIGAGAVGIGVCAVDGTRAIIAIAGTIFVRWALGMLLGRCVLLRG